MRRDKSSQSSSVSCRVSGRSAITCRVGSELPPNHLDAHEREPFSLGCGLDDSRQFGDVRHGKLRPFETKPFRAGPDPGTSLSI